MGIASVILVIASGVSGVLLTVWGRVMPPETSRAKRGFVTLGGFSVICIIAAGILNAISQNRLNGTIVAMASDVRKLAEPAKVDQNLSVEQILAAAASKLLEQQKTIDRLGADLDTVKEQQKIDHGPKRKIRDLLSAINSRIVAYIDAGQLHLIFRSQPHDYDNLQALANDAPELLRIVNVGPIFSSTINNGSLGTTIAGPQRGVEIEATPALKQ